MMKGYSQLFTLHSDKNEKEILKNVDFTPEKCANLGPLPYYSPNSHILWSKIYIFQYFYIKVSEVQYEHYFFWQKSPKRK